MCTFRGLTQRKLSLKLEYTERNADVPIAQYESSHRVPKNNTLMKMAKSGTIFIPCQKNKRYSPYKR